MTVNKKKALDRHSFAEVLVRESGTTVIHAHLTDGEYTTHELALVINKLTEAKERADKVRRAVLRDKRKEAKKNTKT